MAGGPETPKADYKKMWRDYYGWRKETLGRNVTSQSEERAKQAASGLMPGSSGTKTGLAAIESATAKELAQLRSGFTFRTLQDNSWRLTRKEVYNRADDPTEHFVRGERIDKAGTARALTRGVWALTGNKKLRVAVEDVVALPSPAGVYSGYGSLKEKYRQADLEFAKKYGVTATEALYADTFGLEARKKQTRDEKEAAAAKAKEEAMEKAKQAAESGGRRRRYFGKGTIGGANVSPWMNIDRETPPGSSPWMNV